MVAIVLWNTVYLERATTALNGQDQVVDDALLQYLSPLGWEHVNLTGATGLAYFAIRFLRRSFDDLLTLREGTKSSVSSDTRPHT